MKNASLYLDWLVSRPLWVAGPMFDKELRGSSRRRRHYILRFAYVCLLAVLVVHVWYVSVRLGASGSAVFQASRLGEAGKRIVTGIVWFQFITAQILAAVLLSDAISGEIRQRTLDALLVTPISSLRIVTGKLLSRLLQLVLFLAISLPLLAVVRVFGGVPWGYMVSALCITLTAAVFAGSLSLLASITYRHAYQAVLLVGLWYLVVWGLVAGVLVSLPPAGYVSRVTAMYVLYLTNPFAAMLMRTQAMIATPAATGVLLSWPLHCLIILSASAVVLAVAVWRVRKITLASILARTEARSSRAKAGAKGRRASLHRHVQAHRAVSPVKGSPVVWKELQRPSLWSDRRRLISVALLAMAIGVIIIVLAFAGGATHVVFVFFLLAQILQLLFIVRLAATAAAAITREKEARTWPILLTTPLDDKVIVRDKAVAAFRRNLSLLLSIGVLYLFGFMCSPAAREPMRMVFSGVLFAASWIGTVVFLLGLGLYLSSRVKTTTAAVASTLAVYFGLKFFCCGTFSPLVFLAPRMLPRASMMGNAGGMMLLPLVMTTVYTATYAGAGLLFLRAAVRRVRRDVF